MAELALTRVDNRLIHGQVIVKWSRIANGNRILIVDDELAKDAFMVTVYQMAAPDGVSVEIRSTQQAADAFAANGFGSGRLMLLFRTVDAASRAYGLGLHFPSLQLGGIPQEPGRKKVVSAVSLNASEVAQLKELSTRGVAVTAQVIPEESLLDFDQIVKKIES